MKTMFLISAVLLAACGGGKDDPDAPPINRIDARRPIDAPPAGCTAPAAGYGTPTPLQQQAARNVNMTAGDETDDTLFSDSVLNADGGIGDIFELQLYAGFGVFAGGAGVVTTGTFTITGDEAQYSTCGVCGVIFTDTADDGQGAPDNTLADLNRNYFASAGTVEVTSITPNLTGTITGLTLDHVTIDTANGFVSTVVGDCSTSIDSLAFDAEVIEVNAKRGATAAPATMRLRLRPTH